MLAFWLLVGLGSAAVVSGSGSGSCAVTSTAAPTLCQGTWENVGGDSPLGGMCLIDLGAESTSHGAVNSTCAMNGAHLPYWSSDDERIYLRNRLTMSSADYMPLDLVQEGAGTPASGGSWRAGGVSLTSAQSDTIANGGTIPWSSGEPSGNEPFGILDSAGNTRDVASTQGLSMLMICEQDVCGEGYELDDRGRCVLKQGVAGTDGTGATCAVTCTDPEAVWDSDLKFCTHVCVRDQIRDCMLDDSTPPQLTGYSWEPLASNPHGGMCIGEMSFGEPWSNLPTLCANNNNGSMPYWSTDEELGTIFNRCSGTCGVGLKFVDPPGQWIKLGNDTQLSAVPIGAINDYPWIGINAPDTSGLSELCAFVSPITGGHPHALLTAQSCTTAGDYGSLCRRPVLCPLGQYREEGSSTCVGMAGVTGTEVAEGSCNLMCGDGYTSSVTEEGVSRCLADAISSPPKEVELPPEIDGGGANEGGEDGAEDDADDTRTVLVVRSGASFVVEAGGTVILGEAV